MIVMRHDHHCYSCRRRHSSTVNLRRPCVELNEARGDEDDIECMGSVIIFAYCVGDNTTQHVNTFCIGHANTHMDYPFGLHGLESAL
jgi:hypothetical protein